MSPVSAMIFAAFGGLWVILAIMSQRVPSPLLCAIPVAISATLIALSVSVAKARTAPTQEHRSKINKIVAYASAFEGVAIFIGINVLNNIGMPDQYLSLMALIVGLHFLPFARYIPDWRYYPVALSLITIGIIGFFLGASDARAWFVGLSSACVLWAASIIALRTNRHVSTQRDV